MQRFLFLFYGLVSYLVFFITFLCLSGFMIGLFLPKTLDGVSANSLMFNALNNVGLMLLFAVQHSIMARPAFKRWWTKVVPEPIERSTYVLFSSLCLVALMWFWQPMGGVVWVVEEGFVKGFLYALFALGAVIVLVSTFLINHFDLFGLRQVWFYFRERPYSHLSFRTPFFYNYVRHPLYVGWLIMFWAAPTMTATHLLFAIALTAYILVAIQFEERDLIKQFGEKYRQYRLEKPMLIPFSKRKPASAGGPAPVVQPVEADC
jgi:protein-S-isoprenylcysteine O-methyltransferase Ste14